MKAPEAHSYFRRAQRLHRQLIQVELRSLDQKNLISEARLADVLGEHGLWEFLPRDMVLSALASANAALRVAREEAAQRPPTATADLVKLAKTGAVADGRQLLVFLVNGIKSLDLKGEDAGEIRRDALLLALHLTTFTDDDTLEHSDASERGRVCRPQTGVVESAGRRFEQGEHGSGEGVLPLASSRIAAVRFVSPRTILGRIVEARGTKESGDDKESISTLLRRREKRMRRLGISNDDVVVHLVSKYFGFPVIIGDTRVARIFALFAELRCIFPCYSLLHRNSPPTREQVTTPPHLLRSSELFPEIWARATELETLPMAASRRKSSPAIDLTSR